MRRKTHAASQLFCWGTDKANQIDRYYYFSSRITKSKKWTKEVSNKDGEHIQDQCLKYLL